jgi:LPXTG-motif cell wall-anchored protein
LLRLIDPVTALPVTSVTVPEGVYTANSDGTITFDPNPNYAGTATPVTYRVTDSLGQSDTATYTPTVNPPRDPAANPDTTSGWVGMPQGTDLVTNDSSDASTSLIRESVRLCVPVNSISIPSVASQVVGSVVAQFSDCIATTVIVPGVGEYVVENGLTTFTPELNFVGRPSPIGYLIRDLNNRVAYSTYTPEVLMPARPSPAQPAAINPLTVKNAVATYLIEKLPKTGAGNFSFALSLMFVLALIGTGLLIHAKRSQRIRLDLG